MSTVLAVDEHRVHAASCLRKNQLARGAVERQIGEVGEIDQRQVCEHSGPDVSHRPGKPDCARAADGRGLDCVLCQDSHRLRIHAACQQREQLHRLEEVLAIAAAAIVATQCQVDARSLQIAGAEQRRS